MYKTAEEVDYIYKIAAKKLDEFYEEDYHRACRVLDNMPAERLSGRSLKDLQKAVVSRMVKKPEHPSKMKMKLPGALIGGVLGGSVAFVPSVFSDAAMPVGVIGGGLAGLGLGAYHDHVMRGPRGDEMHQENLKTVARLQKSQKRLKRIAGEAIWDYVSPSAGVHGRY